MVAHVKISGLPHADAPDGEELIEVVQHGVNKQMKVTHLFVKGLDGKDGKDGLDGTNGQNAYEMALEDGFQGSKDDWLDSLKGPSAYDLAKAEGYTGTPKEWVDSLKGQSAYEAAVQEGFTGTPKEWVESFKPPTPYDMAKAAGFEGDPQSWLDSLKGKDGQDGRDGIDGESVWDIAVRNGFQGSEGEFLTSLRGRNGVDGRDGVSPPSNFEWWRSFQDNPETVTFEDYLNAIRGYPGKDGTNGKDGKNGLSGGESVYLDNGVISNSGAIFTFDANVANYQAVQVGAPMTIKFVNMPPAGLGGEYLLKLINGGAFTLTWGTPINWQLPQGGYTTNFGEYGIGLLSNGIDFIFLWTDGDGSGKLYGKVMR